MNPLPPLQVLADPYWAGRHPYHDSRFITTADGVFEGPDDGPEHYEFTGTQIVAQMRDCQHQAEYAELFAAAPDLLAALESFLRAPSIGSSGPGSVVIEVQDFTLKAARAAIAKATIPAKVKIGSSLQA